MSTLSSPSSPAAPPGLLTAAEFAARYANAHAELIKGVVREYPVPMPKHGFICVEIASRLNSHVKAHALGRVASNDSWVQTGSSPDTVRGGDVCFWSYERLPKGKVPEGLLPVAPDLVVEVRSPSNRWNDVFAKVAEYLTAGVRAVVVLDPATATASVYRAEELQQIFHNGDLLTLPEILPGFSAVVSSLFE
jgi:Uma2 family endonuclease